jgi:hypothetical protein
MQSSKEFVQPYLWVMESQRGSAGGSISPFRSVPTYDLRLFTLTWPK